jgi:tripartite-type tricarboxylate transporter receptor subunit TctC
MPHLAGELFKSMAGVDMAHVPTAAMATAALGRPRRHHVRRRRRRQHSGGQVRALAITTAERPRAPTVPPVADTLPGYAIPF